MRFSQLIGLSSLLFIALLARTAPAFAAEKDLSTAALTCDVHGGSFVMDDNDFDSLKNSTSGDGTKITREYFVKLSKRTSKLRAQICDSRALWRSIKAKTATNDDFTTYFPNWNAGFWSEEEQKIILDYQIEMAAKAWQ
jgi:hypothetical protein